MEKQKNSNKITILNIASTIILYGLAFFSGPIFSGKLGTNNYGIAAVYLTWVQLASTVFSLQACSAISVARVNFPLNDQPKFQSSVFSLFTIVYVIFSGFTLLITRFCLNLNMHMVILGLLHGWGLYCVNAANLKFTYEFKADKNLILSVSVSALTIVASIILINFFPAESNYWGRIIGQASIYTIIGIILFIYISINGKCFYNKEYWKFTLPITIPTVFHLLANLVLGQSDKIMLQHFEGNSFAGIYALTSTFSNVLHTLWSALNNSWVPFYYDYTKNNQMDEIRRHAKNYIEVFTIITIGFILLSKEIFHLYAKPNFWDGTDLIPIFSVGIYFIFLYSFPVNFEFYNKKTKTIAMGTSLAAIINIVLNFFLIRFFNIWGAVVATTVSHGFQFLFHYINAKRINPKIFPFKIKDFALATLAVCFTSFFYYVTKEIAAIRWVIAISLGILFLYKIYNRKSIF